MYVKDYMTTQLITITPDTSISKSEELMNGNDINRLPVVKDDQLVGLITRDIIAKNSPSDASSLSKHEMNYLLEKATAEDIMIKKVITVEPDTLLDEAASSMLNKNLGVLLVIENEKLVGIITDKDIFKAFIDISGYYTAGTSLVLELANDRQGVIEEVGDALVEAEHNLTHMLVYHLENVIRIVIHVESEKTDRLVESISKRGYEVKTVKTR